jgi:hypothetical protein
MARLTLDLVALFLNPMKISLMSLSPKTTEDEIRNVFGRYAKVISVQIIRKTMASVEIEGDKVSDDLRNEKLGGDSFIMSAVRAPSAPKSEPPKLVPLSNQEWSQIFPQNEIWEVELNKSVGPFHFGMKPADVKKLFSGFDSNGTCLPVATELRGPIYGNERTHSEAARSLNPRTLNAKTPPSHRSHHPPPRQNPHRQTQARRKVRTQPLGVPRR